MIRAFMILASILVLSGCIKTASMRAEEGAKADDAYCQQIGAAPKTPEYVSCRLKRDEIRAADERVGGATFCNRVGTGVVCY